MTTRQIEIWTSDFGRDYTSRNQFESIKEFEQFYVSRFGATRQDLNGRILGDVAKNARFLEIGCNVGNQLAALERMGFESLYGVDVQASTIAICHAQRPSLNVVVGSALDIPFKDGFADVVFTNNVLIHIAPAELPLVMDEMFRVTKRWIWGFEYFAPELQEVKYRGHDGLLWKGDYAKMFAERLPGLKLVSATLFSYKDGTGLADCMYLLEKC